MADADKGLPVSCECGYIKFQTPSSKPLGTACCHCTSCRKQSASFFGTSVYFPTSQMFPLPADLESKLSVFTHPAESGNTMHCYFCPKCGVRVFHAGVLPDGNMRPVVAIKGGVIESGLDWKEMKPKHIYTRSAVMELPEEWECYETTAPAQYGPAPGDDAKDKKTKEK
ncbi:Mss4-like protein [Neurospora hispaniola]|uniref:Mss4-like protein n=1 Tax=Neurospora hispaniola TaxID=588809 RepID=A0AAJ0I2G7_9PEZI|nr:Mss4-like protein [Neurospora hispaniola]